MLLKSAWLLPVAGVLLVVGWGAGADWAPEALATAPIPAFLLPRPARGLDTAVRGTNGAFPPGLDDGLAALSSAISSAAPLNSIGSVSRSNRPTSCNKHSVGGYRSWRQRHTEACLSSTTASPFPSSTCTLTTGASFSNACCNSPSVASGGTFLTRRLRERISALRLRPACSSFL